MVRSRQKPILALASLCVESLTSLTLFDSYCSPRSASSPASSSNNVRRATPPL